MTLVTHASSVGIGPSFARWRAPRAAPVVVSGTRWANAEEAARTRALGALHADATDLDHCLDVERFAFAMEVSRKGDHPYLRPRSLAGTTAQIR